MLTSKEIRQAFLDFFKSKQHKIVPSAPLVLKNDPTLMFTNSGMVQFKDYFLGNGTPPAPRIADTQKCLRVSGKHNDLEDVGFDGTHHTMFEMLGNWSFGDYFKKEAIEWSWELLTDKLGLPADRLYATVFGGDEKEGLASDEEARDYWRNYLPDNHILDGSKKDNFWEMGAQGPCGPCSEIHFDFRSDEERLKVPGEMLVNQDDPSVVEIWNNVFMQFERKADGSLVVLPSQHVDTGMGFERLCMVLQGKHYTYDTDIFTPFIEFIEKTSGKKYTNSYDRNAKTDVAMRVVADHIRAVAFTIADGQLPASGGAGYVIRRILRRAVRYYYSFLEIKEPFLNKLVPLLADEFADVFPELKAQQDFVQKVILEEERSFLRTLENGLRRLDTIEAANGIISGDVAFELFDTFGFPIDLTELIAREKGLSVDLEGFEKALKIQKNRSKTDAEKQVGDWVTLNGQQTAVKFVGYDALDAASKVIKYRAVQDKKGFQYQMVLDKTPFYPEGGGQVGDRGRFFFGGDEEGEVKPEIIEVLDTKKENDLIIHFVNKLPERMNEPLWVEVNEDKRAATEKNHTATHLLHSSLRGILGNHVAQKGSLVNEDYLRFDFSHFEKVNEEQLRDIELLVNDKIMLNIPLEEARNIPIEEARKTGAMMLFGEKYGETVRMITFDKNISQELCGGTHVKATGEIGLFKIISESAVAAGVRRIEAVTGFTALQYVNTEIDELEKIREIFKNPKETSKRVAELQEENKHLQKQIEMMLLEQAAGLQKESIETTALLLKFNIVNRQLPISDPNIVKTLAYNLGKELENSIIVFGTLLNDKPQLTIRIDENVVKEVGLDAGILIREIAKEIKGGGGGQAFFATAGGNDKNGLRAALKKINSLIIPKIAPSIMYKPSSDFTKTIFQLVKNAVLNHENTEEWAYYFNKPKSYQMNIILKQGRANFSKAFNDEQSELHLPQSDMVDLYCYYYMQMHYVSSLYVFLSKREVINNNLLSKDKNLLFIDFGCGPFTSGAAFIEFYNQLERPAPLKMFYLGIDIADEMLEKAEYFANQLDTTKGASSYNFINSFDLIDEKLALFEATFKEQSEAAVIINLCYFLAAEGLDFDQFMKVIEAIINRFENQTICFIYQNPPTTALNKNWEKLKQKISNFVSIKGTPSELNFTFDDEVDSWLPNYTQPTRRVLFDYYWNKIE